MSTPFLAEMRLISFNFAPKGWALCNGQLMQINQNQALFSLLGTTYGGNGQTTFALPDCRSRVPIGQGPQFSTLGERGGQEFHTLIQTEMPSHLHFANATTETGNTAFIEQTVPSASKNLPAAVGSSIYGDPTGLTTLHPSSISSIGGSQPHENRQPFLVLNMMIALQGVFPSRN
jgi:microcystin-dependent protein